MAQMPLPHHHKTQNICYMTKKHCNYVHAILLTLGSKNVKLVSIVTISVPLNCSLSFLEVCLSYQIFFYMHLRVNFRRQELAKKEAESTLQV